MLNIVEIFNDNREISVYRGFLRIKSGGEILSDIPLDSICAVMATGRAVVWTGNALSRLCEVGIPLVIVGDNYHPNGILLSFVGQQRQTEIQQAQISLTKPLQKQLWATIVKEKIKNQSRVLDALGLVNPIRAFPNMVMSGDTGNTEARAARAYFPSLFGSNFLRNSASSGINSFLNYGYAVVRGTLARLVVSAGLNPSLGLQHHNMLNPFCLVDDLIEPYRPLIDLLVYQLFGGTDDPSHELTPTEKSVLAGCIHWELPNETGGVSELYTIMQRDVWNLVSSIKEKRNVLDYNQKMVNPNVI